MMHGISCCYDRPNRVFKKSSKSKSMTVYIGRRDFYCMAGEDAMIDGMVAVDAGNIKAKPSDYHIRAHLTGTFTFGNDEHAMLGMASSRELHRTELELEACGIAKEPLSPLQSRLKAKLSGVTLYPFSFKLPSDQLASVALAKSPRDAKSRSARWCGVHYELHFFIAKKESQGLNCKSKWRQNLDLRCVLLPAPMGAGGPNQNTSRIQDKTINPPFHL